MAGRLGGLESLVITAERLLKLREQARTPDRGEQVVGAVGAEGTDDRERGCAMVAGFRCAPAVPVLMPDCGAPA